LVGQRACGVLKAQGRADACVAAQGFAELVLSHPSNAAADAGEQLAPHVARQLVKPGAKAAPATLRTTLDAGTQRRARDALRQQLAELRNRDVEDGAVIVLDNASGDVLAWVGSSGDLSQAAAVDAVVAPRQAGSTLKPFLYEQAIEQRWLTAASVLDDAPTRLHTPSGLYIPQDYDHDFKGPVSVRTALGSSLNVPAVRAAVMVSPERFARRLVALGLPIRKPGDFYGYSIALGSPEVTLLSLTNAYRALANGGETSAPRLQPSDAAPATTRVMAAAPSFIVADILSDNGARVPTFGLDSALATRYWSAVKTGTSKDMRDNWCVGFSARYTVGVWVGNASGAPMHAVSGVTGAAPVWRTVMDALQRSDGATAHPGRIVPRLRGASAPARDARRPAGALFPATASQSAGKSGTPAAPVPPAGLVAQAITFDHQVEAARTEWFVAGTETARIAMASAAGSAARLIASPDDRSVIALDPDMPPAVQRLRFEAVAPLPAGAAWRLDGRRVGPARPLPWAPWPGHHELALVDAKGVALDTVTFDVRGAQARAPAAARRPAR
ncbi:MAG TPA: penicillin-binding transpeptidase domain-containing protein, partial [Burkholderiaceae bacterium]